MLNVLKKLEGQLIRSFEKAFPEEAEKGHSRGNAINPQLVCASKPEFGDYQVNGALALAKSLKKSPREVALEITAQLNQSKEFLSICEKPQIAGPGFINLRVKPEFLISELLNRSQDKRLGIPVIEDLGQSKSVASVVIDFSSPNIAKEMHVGHLRSTIIGDSIARLFEFRGYSVLRLNHVGDWGTQFGMLITHLKEIAPDALNNQNRIDLGDLVTFYRQAKVRFDEDESFQCKAREEVVRLQSGDLMSLKAWKLLCDQSRKEFQSIYDRLEINIKERGESFYNPFLKFIVKELEELGLVVVDNGAKCVFLKGSLSKEGKPLPVIVQKSDGGFNYSTTDLAAIKYRFKNSPDGDNASRIIYVTDAGQSNHFAGVFEIAKVANWIPDGAQIDHVPFGLVQGEDGKKLKTRSGETVRLRDLLDEAIDRAKKDLIKRLNEEGREENEAFVENVSKTVGIASVKYADLSQNRITNYQFSFDRMLSLQGNTAPYLLYALVRVAGIARKGGDLNIKVTQIDFETSQEWSLVRELLKLDNVILEVERELLPNRLCSYLFELSQVFNRFYDQVPILNANEPSRSSRLLLCRMTADTLKLGMSLLGMPTLERM